MAENRGTFGRMGFVLAAAGSAVGLGNIWKFPYIVYENGGGSFVLIYLVAVVLIGVPIMLAEVMIGRKSGMSPVGAFLKLGGKRWAPVGWMGVLAGFIILSYYAVIAGWTVYYVGQCLVWSFSGFSAAGLAGIGEQFTAFLANGPLQIGFTAAFMALTIGVVLFGVKAGIERVVKLLMPILVGILLLLMIDSFFSPGFRDAMAFLFHVGPISAMGVLEAVGQAFFSLSLGMGAMITYGSYMARQHSIVRSSYSVCFLDTFMGMAASFVMFSIIFAVPAAERAATFSKSATILFTTLPRLFYELPLGSVLAPLFYLLVGFAALTSTISLLEVVVSYFIDVRGWPRRKATLGAGSAIFLLSIPCALSLGAVSSLSSFGLGGVFVTLDHLAANWLLPVGGLLIAVFAGWFLDGKLTRMELEDGHGSFRLFGVWRFLVRILCPAAVLWIIWAVIGGKSFA